MFNKRYLAYRIFGGISIVLLVFFIIINILTYVSYYNFAKEFGADRVEFGYYDNSDYPKQYLFVADETTEIFYEESGVRFYEENVDIIVRDTLYVEYNNLNIEVARWSHTFTRMGVLLFIASFIVFLHTLRYRHFSHGCIAVIIVSIIVVFEHQKYILNPVLTTTIIIALASSIYFYKKMRFFDYTESRLLSIFSKRDYQRMQYLVDIKTVYKRV